MLDALHLVDVMMFDELWATSQNCYSFHQSLTLTELTATLSLDYHFPYYELTLKFFIGTTPTWTLYVPTWLFSEVMLKVEVRIRNLQSFNHFQHFLDTSTLIPPSCVQSCASKLTRVHFNSSLQTFAIIPRGQTPSKVAITEANRTPSSSSHFKYISGVHSRGSFSWFWRRPRLLFDTYAPNSPPQCSSLAALNWFYWTIFQPLNARKISANELLQRATGARCFLAREKLWDVPSAWSSAFLCVEVCVRCSSGR